MHMTHRALVAFLVVTLLAGAMSSTAVAFTDVPSDHWAAGAFDLLEALKVYRGYEDGSARPTNSIRRDEFCAVVIRMLGKEDLAVLNAPDRPTFSDRVPDWAWGYVNVAVSSGIINGYDDATFRAENAVTFAEGFAMLTRALGLDTAAIGEWPRKYMDLASQIGLDTGLKASPDAAMTRADMALATGNAMVSRWGCGPFGLVKAQALLERPPYNWPAETVDEAAVELAGASQALEEEITAIAEMLKAQLLADEEVQYRIELSHLKNLIRMSRGVSVSDRRARNMAFSTISLITQIDFCGATSTICNDGVCTSIRNDIEYYRIFKNGTAEAHVIGHFYRLKAGIYDSIYGGCNYVDSKKMTFAWYEELRGFIADNVHLDGTSYADLNKIAQAFLVKEAQNACAFLEMFQFIEELPVPYGDSQFDFSAIDIIYQSLREDVVDNGHVD